MKVCNFGSLNIDLVYAVDHAVIPGETLSSTKREEFCGGKGLNQSIALARAGATVYHAGCVGADGGMLRAFLEENGVDVRYVRELPGASGHAVIQVDENGQNSILLYGGTNQRITEEMVTEVLAQFAPGDYLVLQNEINALPFIMQTAKERGLKVIFNPSPFDKSVLSYPLETVSWFVVNEIEGAAIAGTEEPREILAYLATKYPSTGVVLTLGHRGSLCCVDAQVLEQPIFPVTAKDTTAAGDTFLGYFFALLEEYGPEAALRMASAASAISVTADGAAPSIPTLAAVKEFLRNRITTV